jgi:hypothetical protein
MKMVEVFKTNVQESCEADKLVHILLRHFPDCKINFDLEDCDKVLRVEGKNLVAVQLKTLVQENGFSCMELE